MASVSFGRMTNEHYVTIIFRNTTSFLMIQVWLKYFPVEVFVEARCWWCSWLRYCAISRKVAGSIPDGVTGVFHTYNPSGRTMALGSTQPLTEMSNRNIFWEVAGSIPDGVIGIFH
jgi:hypothetical protein